MALAKFPWPKKLLIRGRTWKVTYVPDLHDGGEDLLLGLCRKNTLTIEINSDQATEARVTTLLHEIRHAYVDLSAFTCMNDGLEEALCENFAGVAFDLFRNNDMRWIANR